MKKKELKKKLLKLNIFKNGKWLNEYVNLIVSNSKIKYDRLSMQKHHIIPKCYYKNVLHESKLKSYIVDNPKNMVNLKFIDHIRAHCLLSLSAKNERFKYDNYVAVFKIMGHKPKKYTGLKDIVIKSLDEYQRCYEECKLLSKKYSWTPETLKKFREYMQTPEARAKISRGMKEMRKHIPFSKEHRKNLSLAGLNNIYLEKEGRMTHIKSNNQDKLNQLLAEGWIRAGEVNKFNLEQRLRRGRSSFARTNVECYCIIDNCKRYDFDCIRDATLWWFDNFHPFGNHYAECTLQRKIKASFKGEPIIYRNKIHINNIKWYKK